MNQYKNMRDQHQLMVNAFPMQFAFSQSQFKEGMEKLDLKETDTDQVVSIGMGGFIRKSDAPAYTEIINRQHREMQAAIASDKTGEGFIYDMFKYELWNHEYGYTGDLEPALAALGLTREDVDQSPLLWHGLRLAIQNCLDAVED